ncbi:MAG: hypothetical protein GEU28_09495 [Dehalococcoidia bacterium]|nr:hypothetical protein [Dehalococcoidia bacterium]
MNQFLMVWVTAKALILAPISPLVQNPEPAAATSRDSWGAPGNAAETLVGQPSAEYRWWTLQTGYRGHGQNELDFCGGFCFRVDSITWKTDNQNNPVTANTIGAQGLGYDRCEPSDLWSLRMNTGWEYTYNQNIAFTHDLGIYQDCGQSQGHEYRTLTHHYFQNSGSYYMNETHTINQRL